MVTLATLPLKVGTVDNSGFIHYNESGADKKLTVSDFLTKIASQYSTDINAFLASLSSVAGFDSLSKKGADIASATTTNLDTTTGNFVNITGIATITGITLAEGKQRLVRFNGALILTNGVNLVLPSGANITTAAGDFALFVGDTSGVVRCVGYTRASGLPLIPALAATESTAGIAEIATQAETISGTANKIMDPAKLLALFGTSDRSANGYVRLPVKVGGVFVEMIIQFGFQSSGGNTPTTFPLAFPNAVCTGLICAATGSNQGIANLVSISTTGLTVNMGNSTVPYRWCAFGY